MFAPPSLPGAGRGSGLLRRLGVVDKRSKYAGTQVVDVAVTSHHDALRVEVRDEGLGGADPSLGSGILGLKDRVEAIGGTMRLTSPPGTGTSLRVEFAPTSGGSHSSRRPSLTTPRCTRAATAGRTSCAASCMPSPSRHCDGVRLRPRLGKPGSPSTLAAVTAPIALAGRAWMAGPRHRDSRTRFRRLGVVRCRGRPRTAANSGVDAVIRARRRGRLLYLARGRPPRRPRTGRRGAGCTRPTCGRGRGRGRGRRR